MAKRLISVICVIVVTVMCLGMVAYAECAVPFTLYTHSATSTLTISGTKATCTSKATGYSGETTKIVIEQTLQKKLHQALGVKWLAGAKQSQITKLLLQTQEAVYQAVHTV